MMKLEELISTFSLMGPLLHHETKEKNTERERERYEQKSMKSSSSFTKGSLEPWMFSLYFFFFLHIILCLISEVEEEN